MLSKIKRFHPMHRSLQSWELILDLWVLSLLLFTKSALPCSEKLSIFYTHCLCSVITWAFLTNYHNTVLISSILMKFVSSHVVIDSHVDSPQFPSTDFLKYWIFSQIYVQKHFSPLYLLSTPLDLLWSLCRLESHCLLCCCCWFYCFHFLSKAHDRAWRGCGTSVNCAFSPLRCLALAVCLALLFVGWEILSLVVVPLVLHLCP